MELSEEEKKAIEWLKNASFFSARKFTPTILNLIDKQQKEIEELKKPKYLAHFEDNKITKIELINDYISKDKIREKIKELKNIIEFERPTYEDCLEYTIDILEELLEEN